VKRREGIGGVTIAVLGLVIALSVGIGATAQGGAFGNEKPAAATSGTSATAKAQPTITKTRSSQRTTTRIWLETVISQSATSSQRRGSCIADTRIVEITAAPIAPRTQAQRLRKIKQGAIRGEHGNRGINT
jgi:hypothetical protein